MTGRNFTFLADDGNNVTSQMPADETVVEALLDDGSLVRAWYSSNISEPGDWDFVPVEDGSDEPDDAGSIAARVKAWRPIPLPADAAIKHMVDRFLAWKLPDDFAPDAGISFKAAYNEHTAHPMRHEPTGTNLLDATQAEAMVRHIVEGLVGEQFAENAKWSPVIAEIAAERARQVAEEGWTPEHDDNHADGSLATVAGLYALYPTLPDVRWPWRRIADNGRSADEYIPVDVGADGDGRKRHNRRKRLVIAGALIAAEIERLDRAGGGEVTS